MSINYTPELVKVLMDDRLREVRREEMMHCCEALEPDEPARSARDAIRNLFRRQSPAACSC